MGLNSRGGGVNSDLRWVQVLQNISTQPRRANCIPCIRLPNFTFLIASSVKAESIRCCLCRLPLNIKSRKEEIFLFMPCITPASKDPLLFRQMAWHGLILKAASLNINLSLKLLKLCSIGVLNAISIIRRSRNGK